MLFAYFYTLLKWCYGVLSVTRESLSRVVHNATVIVTHAKVVYLSNFKIVQLLFYDILFVDFHVVVPFGNGMHVNEGKRMH